MLVTIPFWYYINHYQNCHFVNFPSFTLQKILKHWWTLDFDGFIWRTLFHKLSSLSIAAYTWERFEVEAGGVLVMDLATMLFLELRHLQRVCSPYHYEYKENLLWLKWGQIPPSPPFCFFVILCLKSHNLCLFFLVFFLKFVTVKTKLVYLFFAGRGAFILSPDKLLFHHKNKSILKVQLKKIQKS